MNIDKEQATRIAERRYSIDSAIAKCLVGKDPGITVSKMQSKAYALAITDLAEYISHTRECGTRQPHGSYRFARGCDCGLDEILEP